MGCVCAPDKRACPDVVNLLFVEVCVCDWSIGILTTCCRKLKVGMGMCRVIGHLKMSLHSPNRPVPTRVCLYCEHDKDEICSD